MVNKTLTRGYPGNQYCSEWEGVMEWVALGIGIVGAVVFLGFRFYELIKQ